jgi:hypothetical protein
MARVYPGLSLSPSFRNRNKFIFQDCGCTLPGLPSPSTGVALGFAAPRFLVSDFRGPSKVVSTLAASAKKKDACNSSEIIPSLSTGPTSTSLASYVAGY